MGAKGAYRPAEGQHGASPTFGSLFSGIGGLDLGLERAGWRCAWQVESDPWCRRVLQRHWPDVPKYDDVRTVDADELAPVDLMAGGFPCQPVSVAGKRLAQADPRWLWPEFARLLRALRPRLALVENVPGLRGRGLGDVLTDLAASGYDAEWDCVPASAFGAPHRRSRLFVVAYHDGGQLREQCGRGEWAGGQGAPLAPDDGADGAVADAAGDGWEQGRAVAPQLLRQPGCRSHALPDPHGERRPEQCWAGSFFAPAGGREEPERSDWWEVEPPVGRVVDELPRRVDRLRGLGNAVVPQVAEWIGHRLMEVACSYENHP